MSTKLNFSEILETLGGVKLNVTASKDRSLLSKDSIDKNIELVENELNSKIPHDYLSFIIETGAITFNKPIKAKTIEKIPVTDNKNQISVDNFFDFYGDKASVLQILSTFKSNIPHYVLPICEGEAGDLIVINLSKDNYGKIYYWHHEHEDGIKGLYLIANDFNQFMTSLFIEKLSESDASTDDVAITKVSNKFLDRLKKSGKM